MYPWLPPGCKDYFKGPVFPTLAPQHPKFILQFVSCYNEYFYKQKSNEVEKLSGKPENWYTLEIKFVDFLLWDFYGEKCGWCWLNGGDTQRLHASRGD